MRDKFESDNCSPTTNVEVVFNDFSTLGDVFIVDSLTGIDDVEDRETLPPMNRQQRRAFAKEKRKKKL